MVLPPGRDAVSVPGFDEAVNPRLTRAAGEVAAWVDYLLHPHGNDGPRVYRSRFGEGDSPFPNRNEDMDSKSNEYETVSILEKFAADPNVFLRAVQAIAGLRQELVSETYDKLLKGYFTWSRSDRGPGPDAISSDEVVHYAEMNPARLDWMQMRTGWEGKQANAAFLYEEAFIRFQVVTENCLYVVAEHLVRYWAIFDKAGKDLLELMDAFTEECASYDPTRTDSGYTVDIMSVVVSAMIAVTVTVITSGTATVGAVLKTAASTALSKTLNDPTPAQEKRLALEKHYHLRDTAQQYLDGIEAIEREVSAAVTELGDHLRRELDEVRGLRRYEIGRDTGTFADSIPHVADFK